MKIRELMLGDREEIAKALDLYRHQLSRFEDVVLRLPPRSDNQSNADDIRAALSGVEMAAISLVRTRKEIGLAIAQNIDCRPEGIDV